MNKEIILDDLREIYDRRIDWEQLRNKTVLITGPNGMMASYLMFMLIFLNEEKHMNIQIIAMARSLENFNARFNEYSSAEYITVITDSISKPICIDGDIDYIIHAASFASPQYYDVCPVDVMSPNVIGTYYLLQLAAEKKVSGFIMFSSADVYGKITGNKDSITENDMGALDPLDIHSCYSESKRMAETMCSCFYHQYDVPVKILRICHTFAPTMNLNKDPRVFASFMKNIVNGEDIELKSDGMAKRAFIYIADAVAGIFTVLTKGQNGEAYNLVNTDAFVTIRELAETLTSIRKDIKLNVKFKQRQKEEHYTENAHIGFIPPSNEKLKQLGWEAKYNIYDGFERVWQYFDENRQNT